MIKSFKHKGLKKFFYEGKTQGINPGHINKVSDILDMLDAAHDPRDMNYPGSGFHPLNPKADKIYAVSVSGAWRITFKFEDGDAYIIDYRQYH